MKYFNEAAIASGNFAEAFNNLGQILFKYKDYKGACRFFSESIKIAPGYSIAKKNLRKCKKLMDQK